MRVAPLPCWLATHPQEDRNTAITTECALTHVNRVCIDANLLYVHTIIDILTHTEQSARELYGNACVRAIQMGLSDSIPERLNLAETAEPDYEHNIGWVLIALQATYYHLLNTQGFEEALVRVVSAGGDTDTNGAICGALLGAYYGLADIPARWIAAIHKTQPWLKEKVDAFHHACL